MTLFRGGRYVYSLVQRRLRLHPGTSSLSTGAAPVLVFRRSILTVMSGNDGACFANQLDAAMRDIAPLALAGSWDNVGMLLEPPVGSLAAPHHESTLEHKALLCIDMTERVAEEAARGRYAAIVAYHPPIFSGLKKITQGVSLQRAVLRCAREGIAVFSPHTALDTVSGGVNDHIADGLPPGKRVGCSTHEKEPTAQVGRVVTFDSPQKLDDIVRAVTSHLALPSGAVHVCHAAGTGNMDSQIRSVAICAGAGGSVVSGTGVDCYLTGEMSHHEQLAAVAAGVSIILCGHTETERPYLPILQQKLQDHGITNCIAEADRSPLTLVNRA